jgi:hypothetical protein
MKIPKMESKRRDHGNRAQCGADGPVIYGLPGITHGSGHVLHLLSPAGPEAVLDRLSGREGLRLLNPGAAIPCFLELRDGKFDALVEEMGIEILTKDEWDLRKAELEP